MKITFEDIADFLYGATRFPNAVTHPRIWRGYFHNDQNGQAQRELFDLLLEQGWRRTPWQKVFPQQTAGLIRPLYGRDDGIDEAHVRFYSDGVISCELEHGRYALSHWRGERISGNSMLEEILGDSTLSVDQQEAITSQFEDRDYGDLCTRTEGNQHYVGLRGNLQAALVLATICTPLAVWEYGIGPHVVVGAVDTYAQISTSEEAQKYQAVIRFLTGFERDPQVLYK